MSQTVNELYCDDCKEKFLICLEKLSKEGAIEAIQNKKCTECGSENWSFTIDAFEI